MTAENIYNYLKDVDAIHAIVSDRIYWIDGDQGTTYPQISFKKISSPQKYETPDQWQRWRFYILCEDKFECNTLADLLTTHLNGIYGLLDVQYFDYISKIDEGIIKLRDDEIYEMYIDFRIVYH